MTDPDIINLARAAGWDEYTLSAIVGTEQMDRLKAFARLIAEDCAKRCKMVQTYPDAEWATSWSELIHGIELGAQACAIAIREAYKP